MKEYNVEMTLFGQLVRFRLQCNGNDVMLIPVQDAPLHQTTLQHKKMDRLLSAFQEMVREHGAENVGAVEFIPVV